MGTDADGPSGNPAAQWRTFNADEPQCGEIECLASASEVDLLAMCCSDGSVRVHVPLVWGDPEVYRGTLRPLGVAALSADGRFLAALEGNKLLVWDRHAGGQASVPVGDPPPHYAPRLSVRHGMVSLDRDERVVVYRIVPGE